MTDLHPKTVRRKHHRPFLFIGGDGSIRTSCSGRGGWRKSTLLELALATKPTCQPAVFREEG